MDQNDHNIMESTSIGTEEQQDCEPFMTYGNDHIRNLSKQYQDDNVGVCGSLEECLEEWGHFRQYMHDNYQKLKHRDIIKELCSKLATRQFLLYFLT